MFPSAAFKLVERMSYRFVFGASGAGKSTELHKEIIDRATESLRAQFGLHETGENDESEADGSGSRAGKVKAANFVFIVPEQYTMQTQKDIVMAHPSRGILNIDVLSFGRLSHRIFEEAGTAEVRALGDVGKSLIIRKLAGKIAGSLPVIGGNLKREGYISEVKSAISEFMQYGITPEDINQLIDYAAKDGRRGALVARLKDLQTIYRTFLDYEHERFVTTEETLDLVAEAVSRSAFAAESVFVFDGFTGFTPVQNRVVAQIMKYAPEVIISLTLSSDGGITPDEVLTSSSAGAPEDLFYLTRKTVKDLSALAADLGVQHVADEYIGMDRSMKASCVPVRFSATAPLSHLEKNLFRYPAVPFTDKLCDTENHCAFRIYEASSIAEEVRQMCIMISDIIRQRGFCYRDFAVVTGDMASYEDPVRKYCARYGIPVYVDVTKKVMHNPLIEAIRGAEKIRSDNWSYESVFHYLRCGLADITTDETDLLENYCLARGIAGRKKWEMAFNAQLEPARKTLVDSFAPLYEDAENGESAGKRTERLRNFLAQQRVQEKMDEKAEEFRAAGDLVRADEYTQIWQSVDELLHEISDLLGDEPISSKDYLELLEAGFAEINLGTLPQQADHVLVGDLERSRLTQVKVLFVLGADDGNIPAGAGKGGMISDPDREFLEGAGVELAPAPRKQMYIQRLYLYLNLTKPDNMLCVSYADVATDGRSMRPSYLIAMLEKLFPGSLSDGRVEAPERRAVEEQLVFPDDSVAFVADSIRRYADGYYDGADKLSEKRGFLTVYGVCCDTASGSGLRDQMMKLKGAAFMNYTPGRLSKSAAEKIYGNTVSGSVSRLEQCADCYARQYLQYGLRLRERESFVLSPADTGIVLHDALNLFSRELIKEGLTWKSFSREQGEAISSHILDEGAEIYGGRILHSTARSTYLLARMKRVLARTVDTLQYQERSSSFEPYAFELPFGTTEPESIDGVKIFLDEGSGGRAMFLRGRIDRVDVCRGESATYVKIIDYKSGNRDLSLDKINEGRQLQLVVYMTEFMENMAKHEPGRSVVPAAMFYCRLQDPLIEETAKVTSGEEDIEDERRRKLRPTGMLMNDGAVIALLDTATGSGSSEVIPVSYKKDGTVSASARLYTSESFDGLRDSAYGKMKEMGRGILDGRIETEPFRDGNDDACRYCPYRNACGLDLRIPGSRTKGGKKD